MRTYWYNWKNRNFVQVLWPASYGEFLGKFSFNGKFYSNYGRLEQVFFQTGEIGQVFFQMGKIWRVHKFKLAPTCQDLSLSTDQIVSNQMKYKIYKHKKMVGLYVPPISLYLTLRMYWLQLRKPLLVVVIEIPL